MSTALLQSLALALPWLLAIRVDLAHARRDLGGRHT